MANNKYIYWTYGARSATTTTFNPGGNILADDFNNLLWQTTSVSKSIIEWIDPEGQITELNFETMIPQLLTAKISSATGFVPTSRTINSKPLSSDITLTASDVGALSSSTNYVSSVNGGSGAITLRNLNVNGSSHGLVGSSAITINSITDIDSYKGSVSLGSGLSITSGGVLSATGGSARTAAAHYIYLSSQSIHAAFILLNNTRTAYTTYSEIVSALGATGFAPASGYVEIGSGTTTLASLIDVGKSGSSLGVDYWDQNSVGSKTISSSEIDDITDVVVALD